MPEVLTCPSCQRKLQVPESLVGQDVQCPTCGATFLAQAGGAGPAASSRRPSRELTRSSRRDDDDDFDDDDDRRSSRRRRRRRESFEPHRGSTIQLMGILSFFLVPLVLGPIAWIMGNSDLAAMAAGRMDPEGESETRMGRNCGMIATIIWGCIAVLVPLVIFAIYGSICCCAVGAGAGGPGGPGNPGGPGPRKF